MEKEQKRSANFTIREKDFLLSLVKKYIKTLENKKTNAVFNKQKQECWEKLAWEFNASQTSGLRTGTQLKSLFEQMKKLAKQHRADEKLEVFKTGGGLPVSSKVTVQDEKILSMLEENFCTVGNRFDSNEENVAGPSNIQQHVMLDVVEDNDSIENQTREEDTICENILFIYEDEDQEQSHQKIITNRSKEKIEIKQTVKRHIEEPIQKKGKTEEPVKKQTKTQLKKSVPTITRKRLEICEKKLKILNIVEESENENLRGKKIDNDIKEIIKEKELIELKIKKIQLREMST